MREIKSLVHWTLETEQYNNQGWASLFSGQVYYFDIVSSFQRWRRASVAARISTA